VQVDPIKPMLKAPQTKQIKLNCDEPLSSFAFKLNLCRYIKGSCAMKQWPTSLPAPMQYFIRPAEGNWGGYDHVADYTPTTAAAANQGGDCRLSANHETGTYYERFGEASRCFDVKRQAGAYTSPLFGST